MKNHEKVVKHIKNIQIAKSLTRERKGNKMQKELAIVMKYRGVTVIFE